MQGGVLRCAALVFVVVFLAMTACRPRRPTVTAQYFPRGVTIYVAVSSRAATADRGNVAAMVDALEADLRDDGSLVTVVGARLDEPPPVPRLEIQVRDSDSGDAQLRGAGQLTELLGPPMVGSVMVGASHGKMVADVYVVDEGNVSHYAGHFTSGTFGAISDVGTAAGERMGHSIAARLARP